ncbi:histidine kinase [Caballeronia sp. GAFFF1]|uniref:response regulator n=1 Tax=Caballeronia sp. GAFFF1 TaxID=2921779 RepID=UPI002027C918|nr:histidine kinase [Caballeronia sp. GAFFF1]
MTRRVPLDDEQECAFWRVGARGQTVTASCRILIGHADEVIGSSISLLLRRKSYQAIHATSPSELCRYLKSWRPDALLLDTRLDAPADYDLVRKMRESDPTSRLVIIAMSNLYPLDCLPTLREVGFDGHVRRPCSVWRVAELLDAYFGRP